MVVEQERVFRVDGVVRDREQDRVADQAELLGEQVLELVLFVNASGLRKWGGVERLLDNVSDALDGRVWKLHDGRTQRTDVERPLENGAEAGRVGKADERLDVSGQGYHFLDGSDQVEATPSLIG